MSAVLSAEHITVAFGGLVAVDDVSFQVQDGELLAIIGPNGAGKTTLLNAISGTVPLKSGRVRMRDRVISGQRPDRIAGLGVARTFQHADFFSEFTVLESLLIGRWKFSSHSVIASMLRLPAVRRSDREDRGAALDMLARLGLDQHRDDPLSEISYGTRKVLDVLRAMLMEPKVLLLDEPTSGTTGADREQLRTLITSIRDQGIGVALIDHDVKFVSDISDTVLAMNYGKELGTGIPSELLAREDVRAAYVGLELRHQPTDHSKPRSVHPTEILNWERPMLRVTPKLRRSVPRRTPQ
jgi:branched-chain amino acid transport system ATP-binding protein